MATPSESSSGDSPTPPAARETSRSTPGADLRPSYSAPETCDTPLAAILDEFDLPTSTTLAELLPKLRLLGATSDPAVPATDDQAKSDCPPEFLSTFKSPQTALTPFSLNVSTTITSFMAAQTVETLRRAIPLVVLTAPMSQLNGTFQLAIIQLLTLLVPIRPKRAQLPQTDYRALQHAVRVRDAGFALLNLLCIVTGDETKFAGVGSDSSRIGSNFTPDMTWWKASYPFKIYCAVLQMEQKRASKAKDVSRSPTPTTSPPLTDRAEPAASSVSGAASAGPSTISRAPRGRIGPDGPSTPPFSQVTSPSAIASPEPKSASLPNLLRIPDMVARATETAATANIGCLRVADESRVRKMASGSRRKKLAHVALSSAPTNKIAVFHDPDKAFFTYFVHLFSARPSRTSRPAQFAASNELVKMPFIKEAGAAHYTAILSPVVPHTHPDYLLATFSSLLHSPEQQQLHFERAMLGDHDLQPLLATLGSSGLTPYFDPAVAPFQLRTGQPIPPHLLPLDPAVPSEEPAGDEPSEKDPDPAGGPPGRADDHGPSTSGSGEGGGSGTHDGRGCDEGAQGGEGAQEGKRGGNEEQHGASEDGGKSESQDEGEWRPAGKGERQLRMHRRADDRGSLSSTGSGASDGVVSGEVCAGYLGSPSSRPSTPKTAPTTAPTTCSLRTPEKSGMPPSAQSGASLASPTTLLSSIPTLAGVNVFGTGPASELAGLCENLTPLPFAPFGETVVPNTPLATGSIFLDNQVTSSDEYLVYSGRLCYKATTLRVICKFDPRGAEESGLEGESQKWREVEERAGIDTVLPPVVGYFERAEKLHEVGGLLVTVRHGERVQDLHALSVEQKQRILALYERLHPQGLVHNDIGARNILYDSESDRFRLCDLERTYESYDTSHELAEVARLLDLPLDEQYSTT